MYHDQQRFSGMALRKSRVRDFGGLVVRRFAYAKPVCVRDSRWREKSRRVRKSRTQNRVAYANRVRKSRTQIAPSVRKSHSVKSQQKSRTLIENRVRKSRSARLDFAYATRFAYAILRTRLLKNPPPKIAYAKSLCKAIYVRELESRSLNPSLS